MKYYSYIQAFLLIAVLYLSLACSCRKERPKSIYGGTVYTYLKQEPRTFDPHEAWDIHAGIIVGQIFEGLFVMEPRTLKLVPRLVESYKRLNGARTYLFKLKKGVFFQDDPCFPDGKGRELTADDCIYSWKRFRGNIEPFAGFLCGRRIYRADTSAIRFTNLSRYELQIDLKHPRYALPYILTRTLGYIIPAEADAYYGEAVDQHPVGTGPFQLEKWETNKEIALKANTHYWRKDSLGRALPYLERLIFRILPDALTRISEFRQGRLDLTSLPPGLLRRDERDSTVRIAVPIQGGYQLLRHDQCLNSVFILLPFFAAQVNPPVSPPGRLLASNIHLRRAMNYAVDRKKLIAECLPFGQAVPAYSFLPPALSDYLSVENGFHYDSLKCQKELSLAGYPHGRRLPEFKLTAAGGDVSEKAASEVKTQLEKAGFKIKLLVAPYSRLSRLHQREKSEMELNGWIANFADAIDFIESMQDPCLQIDSVVDAHRRSQAIIQWEKNFVPQAYRIFLYHRCSAYHLVQPGLRGYYPSPFLVDDYSTVWLKKE